MAWVYKDEWGAFCLGGGREFFGPQDGQHP
jgi:hypothetical protein